MTEKIFVSVKEFSKISGIGVNRVYDMCNIKGFPVIRSGRLIKIHREKAAAWLANIVDDATRLDNVHGK